MDKDQKFMEALYEDTYKELKSFEAARGKTKGEIFKLIGYAIINYGEKIKSMKVKRYIVVAVLNMLTKDEEEVEEFMKKQLMLNADKVCKFYDIKLSKKDKQKIVDRAFIGLTYIDRKKQHDENLNNKTHRLLLALIAGKVTLDKVSHNKRAFSKIMDKEFLSYVKKIRRIVISETTRIRNDLFLYKHKGKKVQYCSVLEKNTCADCRDLDGEIFSAEEAYDLIPQHSNCKCYWILAEEV